MYADARISPARINWRQGSGYKKAHRRIYGFVMKTRIDRLIETVSRCILDESKVRLCSVCNARPRAT